MESYNFKEFIDSIEDLSFREMFDKGQERYWQLDREVSSRPGMNPHNYDAENLMGQVYRFLFWMHNSARADGFASGDWALTERVCRTLVRKEQLPASWLEVFKPVRAERW